MLVFIQYQPAEYENQVLKKSHLPPMEIFAKNPFIQAVLRYFINKTLKIYKSQDAQICNFEW